ncbi:MAG: UPF0262 family protein [Kiloniellales bacterium]|nr:UPF0262 family protein [Kiloniellales bacterium]
MDDESRPEDETRRLANITLDEQSVVRRSAEVEHERAVAIYDLLEENYFAPAGEYSGPFHLHLAIEENRLKFDVRDQEDAPMVAFHLALSPFRRLIKDYFMVCETYYQAIKTASPSRIEAIDMGRRGLHNEGSELLLKRLDGKIEVDFDTARRLFTLICVLHIRG